MESLLVPMVAVAANVDLAELADRHKAQEAIQRSIAEQRERIKANFHPRVVVFVDLVGSTAFKTEHPDEPWRWASRVWEFASITRRLVEDANGKVVKYIGDEVMAIFDRGSMVHDALNFVNRRDLLERTLTGATNVESRVKIAIDFGDVLLFRYEGHEELDPQGIPVDRCARIAKYAGAGYVLASGAFVQELHGDKGGWEHAGSLELKGLRGTSEIFATSGSGVRLTSTSEPSAESLHELQVENGRLSLALAEAKEERSTKTLSELERMASDILAATSVLANAQVRTAGLADAAERLSAIENKVDTVLVDVHALKGVTVLPSRAEVYTTMTRLMKDLQREIRSVVSAKREPPPPKYREFVYEKLEKSRDEHEPIKVHIVATIDATSDEEFDRVAYEYDQRMNMQREAGVYSQYDVNVTRAPAFFDVVIIDLKHVLIAYSRTEPTQIQAALAFIDDEEIAQAMALWYDRVLAKGGSKPISESVERHLARVGKSNT